MKRKATQNYSGITICDSIVVSVRKKRKDLRKLESITIAVIGFVSVIMSFLGMFEFDFKVIPVIYAAVVCSAFYIGISVTGGKSVWIYLGSISIFAGAVTKYLKQITNGFKFVYNVIYSDSYHTEINYYKFLKPENEEHYITVFFIFCIWLLAMVIYFFTIYKPNPVITILVTFPVIEIGLYNGIDLPVFWGMLTVAYWFALFSISTTDLGEYSGGSGGFVRKGNLFYPKRQMRLKVTERCAILLIASIAAVSVITIAVIHISDYERSEKINQRRAAVKQAVNSFTFDDLASSVSALTESFGFTFEYESHKLGTNSRLTYKNTTDLVVTIDKKYDGAIYLKGYAGAIYDNNEWLDLNDSALKNASEMFDNFKKYSAYPQDFPHTYLTAAYTELSDITIWIEPKRKKNKSYAPYFTDNYGSITYKYDTVLSSQKKNGSEYSYKFISIDPDTASAMLGSPTRTLYNADLIADENHKSLIYEYCLENNLFAYDSYFPIESSIMDSYISENDMYNDGNIIITSLLENQYKAFVYENYLQVPTDIYMNEVREAFSDILEKSSDSDTASDKILLLSEIRDRINTMTQYSLSPGKTPANRDFVNYFLLENHKGYCTHYATAGVMLARMAGIPARYSTGYVIVGDDFNDSNKENDGSYTIDIKDNRSHAWAEIYLDGFGWVPFEFTAGYSDMSINTDTTTSIETTLTQTQTTASTPKTTKTSNNTTERKSTTKGETSVITTTAATSLNGGIDIGTGGGIKPLTESQKNVIMIISTIALLGVFLIVRVKIILKIRCRKFNDPDKRKSITAIYNYIEKLFKYIDIERGNMSYMDFAEMIEQRLVGRYFNENEFHSVIIIALQASFSNTEPSDKDVKFMQEFAYNFSNAILAHSNTMNKLIIKYIYVLI